MQDSRLNTLAAIGIVLLFAGGACVLVVHAIEGVDWTSVSMHESALDS